MAERVDLYRNAGKEACGKKIPLINKGMPTIAKAVYIVSIERNRPPLATTKVHTTAMIRIGDRRGFRYGRNIGLEQSRVRK